MLLSSSVHSVQSANLFKHKSLYAGYVLYKNDVYDSMTDKLTRVVGVVTMLLSFLKSFRIAKVGGFRGTLITSFVDGSLSY